MTGAALLRSVVAALDAAGVPFMLTGSLAAAYHGAGRATMDIDIVIDPTAPQLRTLVRSLAATGVYLSSDAADEALADRYTASSANSAPAAWPPSTWPTTSSTTARSRIKVLRPELAAVDRRRAVPERDQDHRQPAAPAHPAAVRLRRGRTACLLLRHAVRRRRVAPRPADAREAAADRRRGAHRDRSRRRPRLRAPARRRSIATSSPRTSCCTTAARWSPTSASRSPPARQATLA